MQLRKLAAAALGTLMAGATLAGGVLAADYTLADFPKPFVEDSTANFVMVVGSGGTAAGIASDLVGLLNVAARLGGETVTTTDSTTTTAAGSAKLETTDNKLNLYEDLNDPRATLTDDHLSNLLTDGNYKNKEGSTYSYTQQLEIQDEPEVEYEEYDEVSESPALYVQNAQDTELLRYRLIFTEAAVSDVDSNVEFEDFEDTSIEIMGTTYDIVDTDLSTAKATFVLMGGSTKSTLDHGTSADFTIGGTTYTVTPSVYTSEVIFSVTYDGTTETTDALTEGQTDSLADGTEVGLTDVVASGKEGVPDAATFYIGAQKISLIDDTVVTTETTSALRDDEIKVSDDTVDGIYVDIAMTEKTNAAGGTANQFDNGDEWQLNSITILYVPDDDLYVYVDNPYTDPAFGAWKLEITGLTTVNDEEIKIRPATTTRIEAVLPLYSGSVTVPTHFNVSGGWQLGRDADDLLIVNETAQGANCTIDFDIDTDKDDYFVITNAGNCESHLMRVDKLDESNNQLTFKEMSTSDKVVVTYTDGTAGTFTVGSLTIDYQYQEGGNNLKLDLDDSGTLDDAYNVPFYTKNCAAIYLWNSSETNATQGDGTVNWGKVLDVDAAGTDVAAYEHSDAGAGGVVFFVPGFTIIEEQRDENTDKGVIAVPILITSSKADVDDPKYTWEHDLTGTSTHGDSGGDTVYYVLQTIVDTDKYEEYTKWGTKIEVDHTATQSDVTITYSDEEAYANVYISEVSATAGETTTGTTEGVIKTAISAVDTDVTETQKTEKHLILGGGPCINKLTAEALGLTYPACGATSTIPENGYLIKLVKSAFAEGKYALVIAGWEATQTTAAMAKVQANLADTTGMEYSYPTA